MKAKNETMQPAPAAPARPASHPGLLALSAALGRQAAREDAKSRSVKPDDRDRGREDPSRSA